MTDFITRLKLDVSAVAPELRRIAAEANAAGAKLSQASIGGVVSAGTPALTNTPASDIRSAITTDPAALGKAFAQIRETLGAELTKVKGILPNAFNSSIPDLLDTQMKSYIGQVFGSAGLSATPQSKYFRAATGAYQTEIAKGNFPANIQTASPITPADTTAMEGLMKQREGLIARIVETEAATGLQISKQFELQKLTTQQLESKLVALREQAGAVRAQDVFRRVRDVHATGDESLFYGAQENTFNRGTTGTIQEETVGLIRKNSEVWSAIVAGRVAIAELTDEELAALAADRAGRQESIALRANRLKQEAALKTSVEDELRGQGLTSAGRVIDPKRAATNQVADERIKAEQALAAAQLRNATDYQRQGLINAQRTAASNAIKTSELRELSSNQEFLKSRADRIVAERQFTKAQREANLQAAKEAGLTKGGLTSRLLARFGGGGFGGGGGDGIPPTLGQFFGHGAANSARYALPGAVAFGAINGIKDSIKEAEELERVFASVRAQFDASFGPEASSKFEAFRGEILKISRDTGVAADDLALVGLQLQGAFGEGTGVNIGGKSGTGLVQDQIRSAAEISKVTQLSSAEITDSLTAISLGFDVSFRKVGDVTLNLQDRFGVLAKQIIPFLGDIAPVAQDAGFSLEEFATIAAVTQQKSGRSGSSLAEAYGRVIPAIAEARGKLAELSLTNTNLGADFVKTVTTGSIKDVFFEIANSFEGLNQGSKDFVINLLGGRREASAILAAFNDSARLQEEINKTNNNDGQNTLAKRYEVISKTLTENIARLKEEFKQLGVAVYEGGLGDALKGLISSLSLLTEILAGVFGVFKDINDATDGWTGKVLGLALAYVTLSKALTVISQANLLTSLGGVASRVGASAAGRAGAAAVPGSFLTAGELGTVGAGTAASAAPGLVARAGLTSVPFASGAFSAANIVPTVAVATVAAFVVKGMADGVVAGIDKEKERYASYTNEQLQGEFEKAGPSGISSTFKRGLTVIGGRNARESDFRNLALDQYNKNNFETSGAIPLRTFDQGVQLTGFGINGDELDRAINDKEVIAETRARITKVFKDSNTKEYLKLSEQIADTQAILNDPAVQEGKGQAGSQYERNKSLLDQLTSRLPAGGTGTDVAALRGTEAFVKGGNPVERKKIVEGLQSENDSVVAAALAQVKEKAATNTDFALFLYSLVGTGNKSFDEFLADLKVENAKAKAKETNSTAVTANQKSLAEVKDLYDLGQASVAEYLNKLVQSQAFYANQIELGKSVGLDVSADVKSLAQINKAISELTSGSAFDVSNLIGEFNQINRGKGDETDLGEVDRLTALIESGKLNPEDKLKAAKQVISLLQGLDEATAIPESVRTVLAEAYFDPQTNVDYAQFLQLYATVFGSSIDSATRDALIAVALGTKTKEEVIALINNRAGALAAGLAQLEAAGVTGDEIAAAGGSAAGVGATSSTAVAAAQAKFEAQLKAILTPVAAGVPKIAASSKKEADITDKIQSARRDYLKALIEGNPVLSAQQAIEFADEDLAQAKDEAERYTAMAAQVRAARQKASAEADVRSSRQDLASALAEYRGDSVAVANIAVEQALAEREKVNKLFETGGAGEADKNKAEIGVINARAKARDAQLSSQKDDYQFLYDMGKITKSQFINYLQTLKQIPDLTTEQIRDLDRQIKQLQGELNQDLQFNLPSKLKLPTLYEVNRIGQSGSSQAGYVDNRNVSIVLNVNDGTGQQQMVQMLTDVIGAPSRIGTGTRRY